MYFIAISVLFNLFWFAAVIGRRSLTAYLCFALVIAFIHKPQIITLTFVTALIGMLGDSLLTLNKVLIFETRFLPPWLALLWLAFSYYIYAIKAWILHKSSPLLLCLGTLGGMLSYLAGERLGSVSFYYPLSISLCLLALAWFCYSLIILSILKKFSDREH